MTRAKRNARRGSAPGRVRIIAGQLRGSVLDVPDRPGLRPTPNRLRETLFNWLAPALPAARCLDLFAGSGALGIEALSRGAGSALLVERDAGLAEALRVNLQRLGPGLDARVHGGDASALLATEAAAPFDIVFVDPPFAAALWEPVSARLEAGGWLASQALIYLEMPAIMSVSVPRAWRIERDKTVGDVRAMLYRRRPDPLS